MKEEYRAYIVSTLIGVLVGTLYYYFSLREVRVPVNNTYFVYYPIEMIVKSHIYSLLCFNIVPLSVLLLSFILSRKFPIVWEKTRTRLLCVILLIIIHMYAAYPIIEGFFSYEVLLWPFVMIFLVIIMSIFDPFHVLLLVFVYSSVVTIAAAYVVTIGMENLPKRIILAFLLILFICLVAASPITFLWE